MSAASLVLPTEAVQMESSSVRHLWMAGGPATVTRSLLLYADSIADIPEAARPCPAAAEWAAEWGSKAQP